MPLTPDEFTCPTHHVDLTAMVLEALEEQGPPVAFGPRRFRVLVSCPGGGSAAHQLACAGEYEP